MNASDLWEAGGRGAVRWGAVGEMAGAEGLPEWLWAGPLVTSPRTRGWDVETSPWGVGVRSTLGGGGEKHKKGKI